MGRRRLEGSAPVEGGGAAGAGGAWAAAPRAGSRRLGPVPGLQSTPHCPPAAPSASFRTAACCLDRQQCGPAVGVPGPFGERRSGRPGRDSGGGRMRPADRENGRKVRLECPGRASSPLLRPGARAGPGRVHVRPEMGKVPCSLTGPQRAASRQGRSPRPPPRLPPAWAAGRMPRIRLPSPPRPTAGTAHGRCRTDPGTCPPCSPPRRRSTWA